MLVLIDEMVDTTVSFQWLVAVVNVAVRNIFRLIYMLVLMDEMVDIAVPIQLSVPLLNATVRKVCRSIYVDHTRGHYLVRYLPSAGSIINWQ
jgi:hypothetical protein